MCFNRKPEATADFMEKVEAATRSAEEWAAKTEQAEGVVGSNGCPVYSRLYPDAVEHYVRANALELGAEDRLDIAKAAKHFESYWRARGEFPQDENGNPDWFIIYGQIQDHFRPSDDPQSRPAPPQQPLGTDPCGAAASSNGHFLSPPCAARKVGLSTPGDPWQTSARAHTIPRPSPTVRWAKDGAHSTRLVEKEEGSGTFCAQHLSGLAGKRFPTPFPPREFEYGHACVG